METLYSQIWVAIIVSIAAVWFVRSLVRKGEI